MGSINILSIDGGGIRGVYAAKILEELEKDLNINITSKFDLIAGTSTGSIVAGAISIGLSPKYILNMYIEETEKIFSGSLLGGVRSPKYDNNVLKEILDKIFMGFTLEDTKTNLLITATNISAGIPWTFGLGEIKLADAILASCCTPLFFNPIAINNQLFADGGLWANNPALSALIEEKGSMVRLISIGSGINMISYPLEWENKDWGITRWGTNLIELIFNMQSLSIERYLNTIMDENQYLRINFNLENKLAMDDVKSIPLLIEKAKEDYKKNKSKIIRVLH